MSLLSLMSLHSFVRSPSRSYRSYLLSIHLFGCPSRRFALSRSSPSFTIPSLAMRSSHPRPPAYPSRDTTVSAVGEMATGKSR